MWRHGSCFFQRDIGLDCLHGAPSESVFHHGGQSGLLAVRICLLRLCHWIDTAMVLGVLQSDRLQNPRAFRSLGCSIAHFTHTIQPFLRGEFDLYQQIARNLQANAFCFCPIRLWLLTRQTLLCGWTTLSHPTPSKLHLPVID